VRLATLILPTVNNDGVDQSDTHATLQHALCTAFGGYTRTVGEGGWLAPTGVVYSDPVAVYGIAMDDSPRNRSELESIAQYYGNLADQISVMVVHAAGDVAFLECKELESVA
jgi:hypothetical protein